MKTRVLGHQDSTSKKVDKRRQAASTRRRKSMNVDRRASATEIAKSEARRRSAGLSALRKRRATERTAATTKVARRSSATAATRPARRPSASATKVNRNDRVSVNREKAVALARRIASRLIDSQERVLLEAEQLVKEGFPARYVSAALTRLQRRLHENGIWSQFDKTVNKKALKATAEDQCTEGDREEAINEIATCVCDETNELLDKCDKTIESVARKHFSLRRNAARIMRSEVERILYTRGLEFKF